MRISVKMETYQCEFPDFDVPGIAVEARTLQEAAEKATDWWEKDLEDWSILRAEDTLSIQVIRQSDGSTNHFLVCGDRGRYIAKSIPREELGRPFGSEPDE